MFQAVQIETQSEQQGLTHLRAQRTTRCTCRELALHRREQALDQGTAAVEPLWEMHAASRRALHARAKFSFRAWRESRSALRGVWRM